METAVVREYARWCGGTAALPPPTRSERLHGVVKNKKFSNIPVGDQQS